LADNAVNTENITDGGVANADLAADAVTNAKLADDAVDTENIADDAITADQIDALAVGTAALAADAVTNAQLADNAVNTENITDGGVANADLENSSVTIGDTPVSLGATVTAFTGLTSVTSTTFVGSMSGNAATATALETARNIGGVSFDGTADISLPGVNTAGNQNTSGNAATATALATGRDFSATGDATATAVSFDGSGNVALALSLATNSVDSDEIATSAVGSDEILDASVANTDLTNSSVTIGDTPVSLGATVTTFTGLTSVTSTDFVGDLTGTVNTATQNSITTMTGLTTVGTIGTGTWQGTAVADTYVADDLTISGGTINNTPIGQTTAAAGDFTAVNVEGAAVVNELRGAGTVFEVYDSNAGSALTVNADGTTTIQDLSLTNSFNLTGSMTASVFTTTTANPTANNHLTHKAYVDAADATLQANIDAVTGAAEAFSVDATLSAYSTGLTYYLNGSVLMYGTTSTEGAEEYTFTVYGSDLDHATPGKLYFRGSYIDLAGHDWSVAGGTTGPQATFTLSWAEINAWTTATLGYAAPGIESGSMSFDLIIDGKNTGLNLDVELDNTTVTVPVSASFN